MFFHHRVLFQRFAEVLDASLIFSQPFSTAEQVVGKIFSLGNSNISVSSVWFSAVTRQRVGLLI